MDISWIIAILGILGGDISKHSLVSSSLIPLPYPHTACALTRKANPAPDPIIFGVDETFGDLS